MFSKRFILLSTFAGMLLITPIFAEELTLSEFKSRKAQAAVSAYQRKIKAARAEFDNVSAKETGSLIEQLEDVQKKETSDGDLDEALKIRTAIEQLKTQIIDPQKKDLSGILGLWKLEYSDGTVRYQEFVLRGGAVHAIRTREVGGEIYAEGAVEFQEGNPYFLHLKILLERYSIQEDRLFIEHWNLASNKSIDRFPTLMGIATRVNKNK